MEKVLNDMRKTLFFPLSAALLLAPATARAQEAETPPPAPPAPAVVPAVPATPVPPAAPVRVTAIYVGDDDGKVKSEALRTKINLEANGMPLTEALKQVLEQAKIPYQIEPDVPADAKVTMTLKNVPASDALSLLTRESGIGWVYEKKDKDEKVSVGKKYVGHRYRINTTNGNTFYSAPYTIDSRLVEKQVQDAMKQATEASKLAQKYQYQFNLFTSYGVHLPDTRVKLDVRNGNLRDILKDVLKQAHLDYALDNDVPEDQKRSFTFENVPIATALDVITRSADIGWRAQRQPTAKTEKDQEKAENKAGAEEEAKVLILIGKKYAHPDAFGANNDLVQPLAPNVWAAKAPSTVYSIATTEQRSTFTCPNCHRRVTIVRRDGEERDWKFCPLCGKPVDVQANRGSRGRREVEREDDQVNVLVNDALTPLSNWCLTPQVNLDLNLDRPNLLLDLAAAPSIDQVSPIEDENEPMDDNEDVLQPVM
jgi:hypothetical protein